MEKREDIVITEADKGWKVIVMDKEVYIEECEKQLNNDEFYIKLDEDPTNSIVNEIEAEIKGMVDKKLLNNKESQLLTKHLTEPRMSGLPKIHNTFTKFPSLRPIVSAFSSCTSRLSEYLDSFLKFQAKKGRSYIRDTKDFLSKLQEIKSRLRRNVLYY